MRSSISIKIVLENTYRGQVTTIASCYLSKVINQHNLPVSLLLCLQLYRKTINSLFTDMTLVFKTFTFAFLVYSGLLLLSAVVFS